MKVRERWTQSNGTARLITGLSALFLLQIGICALTPGSLDWLQILFGQQPNHDPFANLETLLIEAALSALTFIALFMVWVVSPRKTKSVQDRSDEASSDH